MQKQAWADSNTRTLTWRRKEHRENSPSTRDTRQHKEATAEGAPTDAVQQEDADGKGDNLHDAGQRYVDMHTARQGAHVPAQPVVRQAADSPAKTHRRKTG